MTIQVVTIPNYDSAEQMVVMTIVWSSSCLSIPEVMWSHAGYLTTHSQLHHVPVPGNFPGSQGGSWQGRLQVAGMCLPHSCTLPRPSALVPHCPFIHHCTPLPIHMAPLAYLLTPSQLTWNLHAHLCIPSHTYVSLLVHSHPHTPSLTFFCIPTHPFATFPAWCSHFSACGPGKPQKNLHQLTTMVFS